MKAATIKLLDKFFNSKAAVTLVTLMFASLAGYNIYDFATVISETTPVINIVEPVISKDCGVERHLREDHQL